MRAKKLFNKTLLLGTTFSLVAIGAYVPISKAADEVNLAISKYSDTYWETNDLVQYDFVDEGFNIYEYNNTWTYTFQELNNSIVEYDVNITFSYYYNVYNWYLENGMYCRMDSIPYSTKGTKTIHLSSSVSEVQYSYYEYVYTGCNQGSDSINSTISSSSSGNQLIFYTTGNMSSLNKIEGSITYYTGNYNLNKVDINYTATEDNIAKSQPYYDSTNTYDELEQDIESSVVFDDGKNNLNTNIDVVFIDENGQEIPESEEPNKYLTSPYINFYIKSDGTDSRITGQTETVNNLFIPYIETVDIQVIDTDGVNEFDSQIYYEKNWYYDSFTQSYSFNNNSDIYINLDSHNQFSTDDSYITGVILSNPWNSLEYETISGGLDGEWYFLTSYDKNTENGWEHLLYINEYDLTQKGIKIELIYDNNSSNSITWTYYSKQQLTVESDHVLEYTDSSTGLEMNHFIGYLNNDQYNFINAYSNIGITNVTLSNTKYNSADIYKYNSTTLQYEHMDTINTGETITLTNSGLYKIVAYDALYGNEYVEYLDLYSNPTNQNIDVWKGTNYYNQLLEKAISMGYTQEEFDNASYYEVKFIE